MNYPQGLMTIGIYGGDGREDFKVWNRHEKTTKQNKTKQNKTKRDMFFRVCLLCALAIAKQYPHISTLTETAGLQASIAKE